MRRTWSAMGAVEVFAPVARGFAARATALTSSRPPLCCSGTTLDEAFVKRKLCNDRKRDEPINSVRNPRHRAPRWPQ